jgi:hypothetical protein
LTTLLNNLRLVLFLLLGDNAVGAERLAWVAVRVVLFFGDFLPLALSAPLKMVGTKPAEPGLFVRLPKKERI